MTVGTTISGNLIYHVRLYYKNSLHELASGNVVRYGINGYTNHAIPAYILAVASVEAFVNETFLSFWSRILSKDSPLWNLSKDYLEYMELSNKLILLPELLFQKSFSRDSQPYQDMALLIKIRNIFIHYKMGQAPPKFLKSLDERGISLKAQYGSKNTDFGWTHKLSSSEAIRWVHNTACKIVQDLAGFAPEDRLKNDPFLSLAENFKIIPDSYPREWLSKKGIDPDSTNP